MTSSKNCDHARGHPVGADDVVVVEKRTSANVGDIVVAIVDNEFTLKRLDRERGRVACLRADTHRQMLMPENKAYPIIRPKGELEIFGVVVGQFRLSACYAQAGKYR